MPGYRLDNFDFVAADPDTRPKRTGHAGKVINMDNALKLFEMCNSGHDATDNKSYPSESDARGVSQTAARLLKRAIAHNNLENKFTASTRVWRDGSKWHWRVFLKEVPKEEIPAEKIVA